MRWIYLIAVVAAAVAGMHYLRSIGGRETPPRARFGQATLNGAGISAAGLLFVLVVRGMVTGPWWWPIVALVVGAVVNAAVEETQFARLAPLWILLLVGGSAGLTALLLCYNTLGF